MPPRVAWSRSPRADIRGGPGAVRIVIKGPAGDAGPFFVVRRPAADCYA